MVFVFAVLIPKIYTQSASIQFFHKKKPFLVLPLLIYQAI